MLRAFLLALLHPFDCSSEPLRWIQCLPCCPRGEDETEGFINPSQRTSGIWSLYLGLYSLVSAPTSSHIIYVTETFLVFSNTRKLVFWVMTLPYPTALVITRCHVISVFNLLASWNIVWSTLKLDLKPTFQWCLNAVTA